jgi:hypothetical protein
VTRRHATILALSLATLGLACIDLTAPKGPAAISLIRLPAAFVVRGDVMRDSAGTPAAPLVFQFNANGVQTGAAPAQFFILDSAPVAHFDPTTGVLVGDRLGIVNFIAQVTGLQTPTVQVPVTVEPQVIDEGTGALDTIKAPLNQDTTLVLPINGGASKLPVIVSGVGDTGVQGVVVHYTIIRTLASSSPTRQAVYITNATALTNVDTTSASPQGATLVAQLNVKANLLADAAIATGQKVDSVIVQATATYKGTPLAGSPVTFLFHVVGSLTSPSARSPSLVSRGGAVSYTDNSRSSRGR